MNHWDVRDLDDLDLGWEDNVPAPEDGLCLICGYAIAEGEPTRQASAVKGETLDYVEPEDLLVTHMVCDIQGTMTTVRTTWER